MAAAPPGIAADRGELRRGPPDLVRRGGGRAGHQEQPFHAVGFDDGPLQGAHATHRPAHDERPPVDAEGVREGGLGRHLVADGEEREPAAPGTAVGGGRGGARGALAATQHVGRDDEPAIGVQGQARTASSQP